MEQRVRGLQRVSTLRRGPGREALVSGGQVRVLGTR